MSRITLTFSGIGCALAIAATPALASAGDEDLKPVAAALMSGDYVSAESNIAAQGLRNSKDPAMLINLGNAYAGMGRRADAQLAYKAALNADEDIYLDMADGSVRSSREVAMDALQMLGTSYAGR